MPKVNYKLRKGKDNELCLIYVRYGNPIVRTKYRVAEKDWNTEEGELRRSFKPEELTKMQMVKGYKTLSPLLLNELRAYIGKEDEQAPNNVKRDSKWLKSVVNSFHNNSPLEHQGEKTFADFLEQVLHSEDEYRKTEHPILRRFKEFDDGRGLMPNQLDKDVVEEYLKFCENYDAKYLLKKKQGNKGLAKSTIRVDLERWKRAIGEAIDEGVTVSNVRKWNLKPLSDPSRPDTITLTPDEIQKLVDLDCEDRGLNNVRVLFVAMYNSGQRWSDFRANLELFKACKEGYLQIIQEKTGTPVNVPIMAQMREVFAQAETKSISLAHFDRRIKIVCKMAGIDTPTRGRMRVTGDKLVVKPKYEFVTAHTARRSFATNFEPILGRSLTMKATGHKLESVFEKYTQKATTKHIDALKKKGFI